jgi:ferredoxin
MSKVWPVINEMKDAPTDADDWKDVKNKFQYLEK